MPATIPVDQETNPWLAAAARFDEAAQRLKLDDGMCKVLRSPAREITVQHTGAARRRPPGSFHRLPRPAFHCPRAGQRRHPLRPRRHARRSARPGLLDDLEVRRGEYPVWRRQGRRDLRSPCAFRRGARKTHAPLHRRDHRLHRAGARRARAGRQHQRTNHGLDHGHLFHALAPHRNRGGDRQADGARRLAGQPEATRPRLHDRHARSPQTLCRITAGDGARDPQRVEARQIYVELAGPDVPLVIQHNGELLRALETLAVQMLRLDHHEHDLVSFDAGNFKALRAEELRMAAETAAEKVRQTGVPYSFPPMNSRERRMLQSGVPRARGY